jgi:uncharacterized membrane protein YsdA (DUF1294 family)
MSRRSVLAVGSFLLWTVFVWGIVRVRNILGDDQLSAASQTWALVLSATLWLPAVVLGAVLAASVVRHRPLPSAARTGVAVLGVWTTVIWLIRGYDIAIASDHETGFIVVHLVLAVISVGLAVLAARSLGVAGGGTPSDADALRTYSR